MRSWGPIDKKIIVVDIDGVIATGTPEKVYSEKSGWNYAECDPIPEGIILLDNLREAGAYIILHTARWEEDRQVTESWLTEYEVPYDELIMGKPFGDLYIDDKNYPQPFVSTDVGHLKAVLRAANKNFQWRRMHVLGSSSSV